MNMKKTLFSKNKFRFTNIGLLFMLSIVCIFSIGYSNWSVNGNDGNIIGTNVDATFNVGSINQLITFDKSNDHPNGYTCFSFCEEGFIENSEIVSTGTVTFYFNVDMNYAFQSGFFVEDTSVKTKLALLNDNKFNNSSKTILNSAVLSLESKFIVNSSENIDVDYDNDSINETIESIFEIKNYSTSLSTVSMTISFVFNSSFFNLGTGFNHANPPSFNLILSVG